MANKKVLCGDDNEEIRNSLVRALRLKNLEVDLASTPQEILAKTRANNYDVIVTDLEYSPEGREGYDVLKEIKNLPALKVLYSGKAGFEYEAEALMRGADYAILRKDQSKLLDLLNKALGGKNGR